MLSSHVMRLVFLLVVGAAILFGQLPPSSDEEVPTFGVSVYLTGFTGQIYAVKDTTKKLPDFKKLKPIGTVYTYSLSVPPRDFKEGFPGLPDRVEWFAIDYTGRFWIAEEGAYRFFLTSDDGSRLSLDGKKVIDNDGVHAPETRSGNVHLKAGVHELRVSYFQGPRFHVALTLDVVGPDGVQRRFNTEDFKPPSESEP